MIECLHMFNLQNFETKLQKSLDHIKQDIATLRTGKASVQLLDPVNVDAYGSKMKVSELANVSAPDPNMLTVVPWDKSILENIEKAIASSGLNLNPVVAGDMIRIVIPPLTEETRKNMVKMLHQKIEAGKVMMRNLRTDTKKEIEDSSEEAGVSEDDIKRELENMDSSFKSYLEKLDELAKAKEADLMQI